MAATVAIIPARGGSKGIPRKNLVDLCGKPLLAWSILQARSASRIDSVWVSSDDAEILSVAERYGARSIVRPGALSGDEASSEVAWLHAVDHIESTGFQVGRIVGMQATSPLREGVDLDRGIEQYEREGLDSLLSVCEIEDFFTWKIDAGGRAAGVNHDPAARKRRQEIEKRYLENGSFYIFTPALLRKQGNRLGGKIGLYVMDKHKLFQIDRPEDLALTAAIMHGYGLDRAVG